MVQRAMPSLDIVESCDVISHCDREFSDSGTGVSIHSFCLHTFPKRFHRRVVVTIADVFH